MNDESWINNTHTSLEHELQVLPVRSVSRFIDPQRLIMQPVVHRQQFNADDIAYLCTSVIRNPRMTMRHFSHQFTIINNHSQQELIQMAREFVEVQSDLETDYDHYYHHLHHNGFNAYVIPLNVLRVCAQDLDLRRFTQLQIAFFMGFQIDLDFNICHVCNQE